jgi:CMP/dCMP kinase
VARGVAERAAVERLDGGTVWRSMAAELGLSVAEFSALCEGDPAYDAELDRRLAQRATAGDLVLESRLAGWIATNEQLPAVRVWLHCDAEERARRVAERDGGSLTSALEANEAREGSEAARYRSYYGIDLHDLSIYDLVLDSTTTPPSELIDTILRARGADG